jgi:hypothetical protein
MRNITEGFVDESTPDMKYYAFDWDDNIVHMPTKIMLKNDEGEEVGMSTDDFAHFREKVGKEPFEYKGETIVNFANDPFRNFRGPGDTQFLRDAMKAKQGPAFQDFKEAVENGSIFSIITARGHNPKVLREAVYNYIVDGFGGIDKEQLIKNLRKYRNFTDEEMMSDEELIQSYLDMNRYYPVSFASESGAQSPEELKVMAMDEFVTYVKELSHQLNKKAFLKNDVRNAFIPKKPTIGFSDDDLKNLEKMYKHYKDKPDNIVKSYFTGKGKKELRK